MTDISDDFISETKGIRKNGSSFIVGLSKAVCDAKGIDENSLVQIYYMKVGTKSNPKED